MKTKINTPSYALYADHNRRTCILVSRDSNKVKFIPLDIQHGLEVRFLAEDVFDGKFTLMEQYPVEKACQLYVEYSQKIGATQEAIDYLSNIIHITSEEKKMAVSKKQSKDSKLIKSDLKDDKDPVDKILTKPKPKAAPKKSTKISKVSESEDAVPGFTAGPPTKIMTAPKSKAATNGVEKSGGKKLSASQLFQTLILEGKLDDNAIFERVQTEFGLDDSKRGYVTWYRNLLRKKGLNPPAPKTN